MARCHRAGLLFCRTFSGKGGRGCKQNLSAQMNHLPVAVALRLACPSQVFF